jgi:hypothetical protein
MRRRRFEKVDFIRQEILGKACRFCGGRTYQLLFNNSGMSVAAFSAKCTHCHRSRKLEEDLGRILWT